ncbi:MAG: hypothetical protein ABSG55_09945 [Dehalococcoidia bacterium]|jgi:hypothetical protein
MRRVISIALAAALLLAFAPSGMGALRGLSNSTLHSVGEAAPAGLTCSVKPSCGTGEVGIFRMSSTSNAHAGTIGGSAYGNVVCCSGAAGLGTSCSGTHATVLYLSSTDNAHVGTSGYPTQVCLSTTDPTVVCSEGGSCGYSQTCLATISDNSNAHVADCSSGGYSIKVCCYAGPVLPVGGVAEPPDVAGSGSGSSSPPYAALAGAAAGVVALLGAGGWYARRRWQM